MTDRRPPVPPPLSTYRPGTERSPQAPFPPRPMPPGMRPPPGMAMRRPPPPAPKRRGSPILRGILYTFILVVLLVGGFATWLVLAPPVALIRDEVIARVKSSTGRDLQIAGPASLSFYPRFGVKLSDVTLSGPPGMAGAPFAKIGSLVLSVDPLPLLSRQIVVESLVLENPVFDLRIDGKGRKSWDFSALRSNTLNKVADNNSSQPFQLALITPAEAAPGDGAARLRGLSLNSVRIKGGTIRYADQRAKTAEEIEAIDADIGLKSLSSPLSADGNLTWKGEEIDFDGTLTSLDKVIGGQPAQLSFSATSTHFTTTYDGALIVGSNIGLNGAIDANSSSVRGLANWLETNLPDVAGFGAFSVKGQLKTADKTAELRNANIGLDGATATGFITVDRRADRPRIVADLKISALDLNKYMKGGEAAADSSAQPAPSPPAPKPASRPSQSSIRPGTDPIGELLTRPGPQVKGYTQREGWSNEPYDTTLLGLADVNAKLALASLTYKKIKAGQSALTVALANRKMRTDIAGIELYGGSGKGTITVDGAAAQTAIATNLAFDGIDAKSFLADAADMTWLSGKGQLTLVLSGAGQSQQDLVESLGGSTQFRFANGAISGFNVAGAVRGLSEGKLSAIKTSPSEKTDFSELAATFTIANGVAQNSDLKMVSPLLRVGGSGSIALPQRQIDYTLRPKLVANTAGQGAAGDESGLEIPIRITGPWEKPSYQPDLQSVLSDPDKAVNTIKEIGKKYQGKSVNEIADDILGPGEGQSDRAKALLNKFLKPQ